MHRAPFLHRKRGGCSNAEQDPHESCQHHQELHAVTGVQVTEQSYAHGRLTRCVCVCVSSSDWSRAERWRRCGVVGRSWSGSGVQWCFFCSNSEAPHSLICLLPTDVGSGGCMHVRVWAGIHECGTGFGRRGGGGVKGSEQMKLLTFLIIMAGAAEGTSAGGLWRRGVWAKSSIQMCQTRLHFWQTVLEKLHQGGGTDNSAAPDQMESNGPGQTRPRGASPAMEKKWNTKQTGSKIHQQYDLFHSFAVCIIQTQKITFSIILMSA